VPPIADLQFAFAIYFGISKFDLQFAIRFANGILVFYIMNAAESSNIF